jgi:hypothetical protein
VSLLCLYQLSGVVALHYSSNICYYSAKQIPRKYLFTHCDQKIHRNSAVNKSIGYTMLAAEAWHSSAQTLSVRSPVMLLRYGESPRARSDGSVRVRSGICTCWCALLLALLLPSISMAAYSVTMDIHGHECFSFRVPDRPSVVR